MVVETSYVKLCICFSQKADLFEINVLLNRVTHVDFDVMISYVGSYNFF